MKITDILFDIVEKDLWVAAYRKNRVGGYLRVDFVNFLDVDDNDVIFRYISEAELLHHIRFSGADTVLFDMQLSCSIAHLDSIYELIEPVEIYTFDDLVDMGMEAGDEDEE